MNEWGFASEVSKWWEAEFPHNPDWKLRTARVEEVVLGSLKRSDLFVEGDGPTICGEMRLPDHRQAAAWNLDNLQDAVSKASAWGCPWAFTSDGTTILLLDVQRPGPLITKIVHRIELPHFEARSELDSPTFLSRTRKAWIDALRELGPIISGATPAPGMAPDELFVNALRELLSAPVAAIRDALHDRRKTDPAFQAALIEWMVDDQGWLHDPERWEQEVLLTARLTAYVFATRVLFYEALRRSQPTLRAIDLPTSTARVAIATLRAQFEEASEVSGDYETLFGWDRISDYAISSDHTVPLWRRVLDHIGVFDVSTIGHDILGRLFERLIDPNERYEWGQHYTVSDVVDLMLSFAIPTGEGAILDPACGGGTFLVRAYARKKALGSGRSHQEMLSELFGIDVSGFAATISTVNLAVRQLDFSDNYPRVATRSFFRVQPDDEVIRLPGPMPVQLGERAVVPVSFDRVRALVGNPPYVRLHKLGQNRQLEAQRALLRADRVRCPVRINKSANYHLYFWLHGAQFLEPGGRITLLTAGEWMDADYGAALQEWLLANFCIEAFIESGKETWFSEARVGTVVTIARRCDDPEERAANNVRFVLLRRRLREFFGPSGEDEADHFTQVDALRDRIMSLEGDGESDELDWTVVNQAELLRLGQTVRRSPRGDQDDSLALEEA
jgi:AcrR family transcriptional regulator